MKFDSLPQLGWGPFFSQQLAIDELDRFGRVVADSPSLCQVCGLSGTGFPASALSAQEPGKAAPQEQQLFSAAIPVNTGVRPVAGDWVVVEPGDPIRIARVLERRSQLLRKRAGRRTESQVLAANIDTIFVVEAMAEEVNVRRLERFLAGAWSSGARPVIVLNKADRSADPEAVASEVVRQIPGVTLFVISAMTGAGVAELGQALQSGETGVLIGPSGAGKSTLINSLLGCEQQTVHQVRAHDDRGRHTTTSRSLWQLPGGGLLIDCPGVREFGLWSDDGVEQAFDEIGAMAADCRYRDCAHQGEPGCAVQRAIEDGELAAGRLANYQKLLREQQFIKRKQDQRAASEYRRDVKKLFAEYRRRTKASNKS